jgi:hypothetical protein
MVDPKDKSDPSRSFLLPSEEAKEAQEEITGRKEGKMELFTQKEIEHMKSSHQEQVSDSKGTK